MILKEKIIGRYEAGGRDYYVIKVPLTITDTKEKTFLLQTAMVVHTVGEYDWREEE